MFPAGVWSGDPQPESAVVGTYVDPQGAGDLDVTVQISPTTDFSPGSLVHEATVATDASSGFTVKAKAGDLDPDSWYYYRFSAHGGITSPVGRTRTAPAPGASPESLRIAFCSCQNFGQGTYAAWRNIASEDIDFVVFLGDYVYEGAGTGVRPDPSGSANDVDGYRRKYRMYRSDPSLQAAHANFPVVPIWDDHEVVDNYDKHVSPTRRAAGYQAWFEFMPVERNATEPDRSYRSLAWGDLAELFLIDTRQYRDIEASAGSTLTWDSNMLGSNRSILGAEQKTWLKSGLGNSTRRWKLLGNQVVMMPWRLLDFDDPRFRQVMPNLPPNAGFYVNGDSWDGYQHERRELLSHLDDAGVDNFVVLTGDVHSFWAGEVRTNFDAPHTAPTGFEFVGGSVSSTFTDIAGYEVSEGILQLFRQQFKELSYIDTLNRGYGLLDITPGATTCDFKVVDSANPVSEATVAARFRVQDSGDELERII